MLSPVQTDTTLLANNSQHLITIKICLCVLSAKMFENPDVSGLLSLQQWKMPLHWAHVILFKCGNNVGCHMLYQFAHPHKAVL